MKPGTGGDWVFACDANAVPYLPGDMKVFSGLTEGSRVMLARELRDRLKTATEGLLVYGQNGDVEKLRKSSVVLEIRLSAYEGLDDDGDPQLLIVRVYFTEPVGAPGFLVLLGIRAKIPGPLGLREQDRHVKEMERRARDFELGLARCDIPLGLYCAGNVREEFRA